MMNVAIFLINTITITTTTSTLILTMAFTVGFMIGSVTVNHKPQMLSPKTDSNYEL